MASFLSSGTAVSGALTALGTPGQLMLSTDFSCAIVPSSSSLVSPLRLFCGVGPWFAPSGLTQLLGPLSTQGGPMMLCAQMWEESFVWEVPRVPLQQYLSVRGAQRKSGYNFKARESGAWIHGRLLLTSPLPLLHPCSSSARLLSSSLDYRKLQIH